MNLLSSEHLIRSAYKVCDFLTFAITRAPNRLKSGKIQKWRDQMLQMHGKIIFFSVMKIK